MGSKHQLKTFRCIFVVSSSKHQLKTFRCIFVVSFSALPFMCTFHGLVSNPHFRSPTQNLASVAQLRRPCPSAVAQVALMRDSVTCEVGGMEFDTNFRSRTVHVIEKCQCIVF